jgi:hypothetical protein
VLLLLLAFGATLKLCDHTFLLPTTTCESAVFSATFYI